jgi:hypothetical protein
MSNNYTKLQEEFQILQTEIKQKEINEKAQFMSLERKIEESLEISSKSVDTIQVYMHIHVLICSYVYMYVHISMYICVYDTREKD